VAAPKSYPQRQQGVGRKGSIGGRRSGSGIPRRLVRRVWKGPLALRGQPAKVGEFSKCDRECQWLGRSTSPAAQQAVARFRPLMGAAPNGNEWLSGHCWQAWRQPRCHLRSEMPFAAIRRLRGRCRSEGSTSVLSEGRRRKRGSGRRKPSARELLDSSGTRDNKSVADADKRHLSCSGLTAFRRGRHAVG
jgi:hypothetical protein